MPFIEQLGQQAAGNVVGGAMGLILGGIERKKQLQQQQKLQDMQMQGQRAMGIFNREQQMKLWEDTNYSAQMDQLKKAGLNPGLLYGKQGSGGITATQTGNVSGAQARQGGEAAAMGMQMGQAAMTAAQIELLKAQTEKTKAETGNVPITGENIQATTANLNANTAFRELETKFANETYETRKQQINTTLDQQLEQLKQTGLQNKWTEEQWQTNAVQLLKNVTQTQLQNELIEVQKKAGEKGINLTDQQISKMKEDVSQGWEKLRLEGLQGQRETIRLEQTNMDLLLKELQTQFNITHPGLWNVVGGSVEKTIKQFVESVKDRLKSLIPKL